MGRQAGREPLTREAFADAALQLIDEQGIDALTTRAIGEALGVHGTAVYRHFANKDELLEAALARMLETSGVGIPEDGTPRERILGLLRSLRRAFTEHPNLALANLTMQDEQATAEFVRAALALLGDMGLKGRKLAVAYQMLETFHVGTTAYDWGGYPEALEARRVGRRRSGARELESMSRSLAAMEKFNDEVFAVTAKALLDMCEALATGD